MDNEIAETIQGAAFLAGMRGPVGIQSQDGVTIKVGRHVVLDRYQDQDYLDAALEEIAKFRTARRGRVGGHVDRWLRNNRGARAKTILDAMIREHPEQFGTDRQAARIRLDRELGRLLDHDLIEASGHDDDPIRSDSAEWRAVPVESSAERYAHKLKVQPR